MNEIIGVSGLYMLSVVLLTASIKLLMQKEIVGFASLFMTWLLTVVVFLKTVFGGA